MLLISTLPMIGRIKNRYRRWKTQATRRRFFEQIHRILSDPRPPDTTESENSFDFLQATYPSTRGDSYKYDDFSLFERASQRVLTLLRLPGMAEPGKKILEIGAGDGVLGSILSHYGHQVILTDQDDWRSRLGREIIFQAADISKGLPFNDATYDLVASYNSFEHFPEPRKAFEEALRVTKPSGFLHFSFGPLYCSPWGMHAYRSLYMPYSQFLFSEQFIHHKLEQIGITDLGVKRTELQYMNRWKPTDFDALWSGATCSVQTAATYKDEEHLGLVLRYPGAFRGRGLCTGDLTKSSITITLRKTRNLLSNSV